MTIQTKKLSRCLKTINVATKFQNSLGGCLMLIYQNQGFKQQGATGFVI